MIDSKEGGGWQKDLVDKIIVDLLYGTHDHVI